MTDDLDSSFHTLVHADIRDLKAEYLAVVSEEPLEKVDGEILPGPPDSKPPQALLPTAD